MPGLPARSGVWRTRGPVSGVPERETRGADQSSRYLIVMEPRHCFQFAEGIGHLFQRAEAFQFFI